MIIYYRTYFKYSIFCSEVKYTIHKIFHAACFEDALNEVKEFERNYAKRFPAAIKVLAAGLEGCIEEV